MCSSCCALSPVHKYERAGMCPCDSQKWAPSWWSCHVTVYGISLQLKRAVSPCTVPGQAPLYLAGCRTRDTLILHTGSLRTHPVSCPVARHTACASAQAHAPSTCHCVRNSRGPLRNSTPPRVSLPLGPECKGISQLCPLTYLTLDT